MNLHTFNPNILLIFNGYACLLFFLFSCERFNGFLFFFLFFTHAHHEFFFRTCAAHFAITVDAWEFFFFGFFTGCNFCKLSF